MALGSGKKQSNRNTSTNSTTQAVNSTPPAQEKPEYVPQFSQEISAIMRGYGDCEQPLKESVILVEKIVIEQMRSMLIDVINVAIDRKGKPEPTQKDFEFMMRMHPTKLLRLKKYLKKLDLKTKYQDVLSGRAATSYSDDFDENHNDSEEPIEKYDEEEVRRLFRADRITLTLTGQQYADYSAARQTSISGRTSHSIRTKLKGLINPPAGAVISGRVYIILGHLVHETIATLVDYAILTRLDSSNRVVHPLDHNNSPG